jgi:hypothetical protein
MMGSKQSSLCFLKSQIESALFWGTPCTIKWRIIQVTGVNLGFAFGHQEGGDITQQ